MPNPRASRTSTCSARYSTAIRPSSSTYTTQGKLPGVLDFGLQGQATNFAVKGIATDKLRDFFASDDYYTDADSNAYGPGEVRQQP